MRESHRSVGAIVTEIESMRALKHPYICSLFGVFEDNEYVHLIMEYCAGGELFKRLIKRGRYDEYAAAKFI